MKIISEIHDADKDEAMLYKDTVAGIEKRFISVKIILDRPYLKKHQSAGELKKLNKSSVSHYVCMIDPSKKYGEKTLSSTEVDSVKKNFIDGETQPGFNQTDKMGIITSYFNGGLDQR